MTTNTTKTPTNSKGVDQLKTTTSKIQDVQNNITAATTTINSTKTN